MLGNGRLEALCFDGEKRLAHIRGKLRKKVWINQGDIILLSLRDYQDEKGDVILKYSADEARSLKAYGELPESAKINETDTYVFSCPIWPVLEFLETWADLLGVDMDTKAWMITWSSTRIGMIAVMTRRLMLMRSERWLIGEQVLVVGLVELVVRECQYEMLDRALGQVLLKGTLGTHSMQICTWRCSGGCIYRVRCILLQTLYPTSPSALAGHRSSPNTCLLKS